MNKIKSFWLGLINIRFKKKKKKVSRNPLNKNIFEIFGRIDETPIL